MHVKVELDTLIIDSITTFFPFAYGVYKYLKNTIVKKSITSEKLRVQK